ncbi:hypothetical protein F4V91_06895 [Neorhizobium galegae]|uniref:Replication protein n=1 Tax=Neorhizobium galegae TaxID=399 RepID=A0A6A1TPP3_NEOGA|nr:hypothetical protein [Neorhizobium galegae]KAB1086186.1 hypothetical protein F4V91_06895 [Neorhizobium galegae]
MFFGEAQCKPVDDVNAFVFPDFDIDIPAAAMKVVRGKVQRPVTTKTFSARHMVELMHPSDGEGLVVYGNLTKKGRIYETYADLEHAADYAVHHLQKFKKDIYLSLHRYHGKRVTQNLVELGCVFTDLDYYNTDLAKYPPEWIAEQVLRFCDDEAFPAPSMILCSGKGLLCIWLHDAVPPSELSRWQLIQDEIFQRFERFGPDRGAKDAVHFFRLPGSRNSKVEDQGNPIVRLLWSKGSPTSPARYDFEDLVTEIVPPLETAKEPVKRVLSKPAPKPKTTTITVRVPDARPEGEQPLRRAVEKRADLVGYKMTHRTYYTSVFDDLERLRVYRYRKGILPPGRRDSWLFVASVCLAWTVDVEMIEEEIVDLARGRCEWDEDEIKPRMSAVIARAHMAADGIEIEYNGMVVDARYSMNADTIRQWLSISDEEAEAADLRCLVGEDRSIKLASERSNKSKHRRGLLKSTHAAMADRRIEIGASAIEMQKNGASMRKIAAHFGVSLGHVHKCMGFYAG